jgi:hypothetical protein
MPLPTTAFTPEPAAMFTLTPTAPPAVYPTATTGSSGHPAGTTGLCNDGTYTSAQHSQGSCSHHGGLKQWWGP